MSEFIATDTLESIAALVRELEETTANLARTLSSLQSDSGSHAASSAQSSVTPQAFVESVLAWDEQISRARLLLPLCTSGITVNELGRSLPLSDLIVEIRSEFDALARAQIEALIEDAPN